MATGRSGKQPMRDTAFPFGSPQMIVTLDAGAMIDQILRSGFVEAVLVMADDGCFANPDVVRSTERHASCPLFDQLGFCLKGHGVKAKDPMRWITPWLVFLDFSSLDGEMSAYDGFLGRERGKAMRILVEDGFCVRDPDGRKWHYTVFDKSSSNARNSTVSFLADAGYGCNGESIHLYDELDERLRLGIDFSQLPRNCVSWSKYYAYRALYLTTATRVEADSGFRLDKDSVLVLDTGDDAVIPCDVLQARSVRTCEDGGLTVEFLVKSEEDGGQIELALFDGEGLISPEYACYLRRAAFGAGEGSSQPSSFQIRMPFAKGMVHEVDFHRFFAEILGMDGDEVEGLYIQDAFGIARKVSDIKLILTTDMLKCWRWLEVWLDMSEERQREYTADGVPDPMAYYFAEFYGYGHALYVLRKKRGVRLDEEIETNAQFLSTLAMLPDDFDSFVQRRFAEIDSALFDDRKAVESLIDPQADDAPSSAALYALRRDPSYVNDPYLQELLTGTVNSQLLNAAKGKLRVRGTLRYLSQDLLAFLCILARRLLVLADGRFVGLQDGQLRSIDGIEDQCLDADAVYIPGCDAGLNETGWVAVMRNPHLSRSEQCAMHPVHPEGESLAAHYLGHLHDVAMISCASVAPMVLGGADYDGDTVHIYDDAALVKSVVSGAYADNAASRAILEVAYDPSGMPYESACMLERRYPVADMSGVQRPEGSLEPDEDAVGRHISVSQLAKSFRSNVGILSNDALRLSSVLYGRPVGKPEGASDICDLPGSDACANYSIAVGIDIDSVKTGERLDMENLAIPRGSQASLPFCVSGKLVPASLDFIEFREKTAKRLMEGASAIWQYRMEPARPGERILRERSRKGSGTKSNSRSDAPLKILAPDPDASENSFLKGASISNIQRLPWLLMNEAESVFARRGDSPLVSRKAQNSTSPLNMHKAQFEESVDLRKLKLVAGYVKACQSVLGAWRDLRRMRLRAGSSKAFGKARRCAQEYPTGFSDSEIEAILGAETKRLIDYFNSQEGLTPEGVLEGFAERGFHLWACCAAANRRAVLSEFFPGYVFSEGMYALLECDRLPNGFMVPFYLVGAVREFGRSSSQIPYEEGLAEAQGIAAADPPHVTDEEIAGTFEKLKGIRKDAGAYNEFAAIVNRHLQTKTLGSAAYGELISALRERIDAVLGRDGRILDYLSVLKLNDVCFSAAHRNSRALFWDLLSVDDLWIFRDGSDAERE